MKHETNSPARVLLVPGLGAGGLDLIPLAFRLRRKGYRISIFWHFTGRPTLEASARRLWKTASAQPEPIVHFVGHSLGGLVVLRMLADHVWERPGRVVTLGTPHAGLGAARRFSRLPGARSLLGAGLFAAANGPPIVLPEDRELGILAGNRNRFLFGALLTPGQTSDSVIGVGETRHPESRAHLTVEETHVGLLLSAGVASRVDSFFRTGSFR
jgi:pimeloyl-ACP methyl ester carboxylesterase